MKSTNQSTVSGKSRPMRGVHSACQTVRAGDTPATASEENTLRPPGEEREHPALRPGETGSLEERGELSVIVIVSLCSYLTLQSWLDSSEDSEDLRASGLAGLLSEPPTLPGLGLSPTDCQEEEEEKSGHQHHHPAGGGDHDWDQNWDYLATTSSYRVPAMSGINNHNISRMTDKT